MATILFAILPLYDPPARRARRLRGDIAIATGLPEGDEKRRLQTDLERQAKNLREYREVYVGRRWLAKWALVLFAGATIGLLVAYPPFSARAGDGSPAYGPTDYFLMLGGAIQLLAFVTFFGLGLDSRGRTPEEVLVHERTGRRLRRERRLRRLNTQRAKNEELGQRTHREGSTLGFRTQVDALGPRVQDHLARIRNQNSTDDLRPAKS